MRIDSVGADTSYQPQSKPAGMESRHDNSVTQKSDTVQMTKANNQEAEVAAEVRSQKSEKEVIQAIEQANKHIRTYDRKLEFSIHELTKQIMVKVIDTSNDSVIREIPSEKVLDMVGHMWEVAGILVDEKR